jgi:hypothetical protein
MDCSLTQGQLLPIFRDKISLFSNRNLIKDAGPINKFANRLQESQFSVST